MDGGGWAIPVVRTPEPLTFGQFSVSGTESVRHGLEKPFGTSAQHCENVEGGARPRRAEAKRLPSLASNDRDCSLPLVLPPALTTTGHKVPNQTARAD